MLLVPAYLEHGGALQHKLIVLEGFKVKEPSLVSGDHSDFIHRIQVRSGRDRLHHINKRAADLLGNRHPVFQEQRFEFRFFGHFKEASASTPTSTPTST